MNSDAIIQATRSRDPERQLTAIEEATKAINTIVEEVLTAMLVSPRPIFLAERLFMFGSMPRPAIERKFLEVPPGELKVILALSLVQLGSKLGVQELINEIKSSGVNQCLAASALAKCNVREGIPALMIKLEE